MPIARMIDPARMRKPSRPPQLRLARMSSIPRPRGVIARLPLGLLSPVEASAALQNCQGRGRLSPSSGTCHRSIGGEISISFSCWRAWPRWSFEARNVNPAVARRFRHKCGPPAVSCGSARHIWRHLTLGAEASSLVTGCRNVRRILLESLLARTFLIAVLLPLRPAARCHA